MLLQPLTGQLIAFKFKMMPTKRLIIIMGLIKILHIVGLINENLDYQMILK